MATKNQHPEKKEKEGETEEINPDELADYESDEDDRAPAAGTKQTEKKTGEDIYTALHSSGFKEFLLKPELLKAIQDCSFEHPSEVQHECIPQGILGTDVLCQAKSGMGKTAVFVLAVLQQVDPQPNKGVLCLVLCHIRELAYQICHEFDRFKKFMPNVKTAVFYGGVSITENIAQLKKESPHVVIGTPGRILALIKDGALNLNLVKHFVIDECDKVLSSLDMRGDVQKIFKMTPHNKQVLMFSATLSDDVRPVCKKFMHNPLEIYINDGSKLTLHGLQQYYVQLEEQEKNRKLFDLLDALDFNQCVIFVKSVKRAAALKKLLKEGNFSPVCIHSQMPQDKRIRKYKKFKEFKSRIMVATDLFGRGIDIERVNVVINFDMPENSDTYLHRVGRAGRFGTKGLAISFVSSPTDSEVLNQVQARFVVQVNELPDEIDTSSYMQS